jgi:hypothetical protein
MAAYILNTAWPLSHRKLSPTNETMPSLLLTAQSWSDIPGYLAKSISQLLDCGAFHTKMPVITVEGHTFTAHYLSTDAVSVNPQFLTTDQRLTLFDVALETDTSMAALLRKLKYETVAVSIDSELYLAPVNVCGVWPTTSLWGRLLQDGRIE